MIICSLAILILLAALTLAETHEVRMSNRNTNGTMVCESDFLTIASDDTVGFMPADRGHNV